MDATAATDVCVFPSQVELIGSGQWGDNNLITVDSGDFRPTYTASANFSSTNDADSYSVRFGHYNYADRTYVIVETRSYTGPLPQTFTWADTADVSTSHLFNLWIQFGCTNPSLPCRMRLAQLCGHMTAVEAGIPTTQPAPFVSTWQGILTITASCVAAVLLAIIGTVVLMRWRRRRGYVSADGSSDGKEPVSVN